MFTTQFTRKDAELLFCIKIASTYGPGEQRQGWVAIVEFSHNHESKSIINNQLTKLLRQGLIEKRQRASTSQHCYYRLSPEGRARLGAIELAIDTNIPWQNRSWA